jgi:hypothetical protein
MYSEPHFVTIEKVLSFNAMIKMRGGEMLLNFKLQPEIGNPDVTVLRATSLENKDLSIVLRRSEYFVRR